MRKNRRKSYSKVIKQILAVIRKNRRFLITTHARCDGDAVGSELALKMMLNRLGKSADIVNVGGIPKEFMFLPGMKSVANGTKHLKHDYVIYFH